MRTGRSPDAVVVEEVLALVSAVGQARERLAHLRLGLVVQALESGARSSPRRAPRNSGSGGAGRHVVAAHWAKRSPSRSARPRRFASRKSRFSSSVPSAVKRRSGGMRRPSCQVSVAAARSCPAQAPPMSRPMGQVDGEGEQPLLEEDRPDGLDVGQMIAAHLGQVEEPDVAVRRRSAGCARGTPSP